MTGLNSGPEVAAENATAELLGLFVTMVVTVVVTGGECVKLPWSTQHRADCTRSSAFLEDVSLPFFKVTLNNSCVIVMN